MGKKPQAVARVEAQIQKVETIAPPISAIEIKRRSLLNAMFDTLTNEDMAVGVRKQADKMREGDGRSFDRLRSMVQAGVVGTPHSVSATQVNVYNSGDQPLLDDGSLLELRKEIVYLLDDRKAKGMRTPAIAREFNIKSYMALAALQHGWFRCEVDGWHITSDAEAEVLQVGAHHGNGKAP